METVDLWIRTCLLRTGISLAKEGGALSKMLLPFKLEQGGRMGKGSQWMSWIHIEDIIGLILNCMDHDEVSGAIKGSNGRRAFTCWREGAAR
jgi:NAD dependent epimerase/dehydratase family enzyme